MKKNKLNTPTTKWSEDNKKCLCQSCYTIFPREAGNICPECNVKLHKLTMCNLSYVHDFRDVPCKKCHVGGRLSWWWKVIKSWYYKI